MTRDYRETEGFNVVINDFNEIDTSTGTGYWEHGDFSIPYGSTLWPEIAMPGWHWSQGHLISGASTMNTTLIYTIHIPFTVDNATGISSFVAADNNLTDEWPEGILFQGILYSDESVESRDTRQEIRLNGEMITDNVYDVTGHNVSTLGYIGFLF